VPRLFVAIELPADIKQRLAPLCHGVAGAKWRGIEQFHLTLRFIGEVDGAQARDIDLALAEIELPPFELALRGIGHFGDKRRPRALWTGVGGNSMLKRLNRRVERVLSEIGIALEARKFTPHVTLAYLKDARMADVNAYEGQNGGFATPAFPIDHFSLFSSFLSSSGAIYSTEAEYSLV
jgi:2'-5' RNA ligase